MSLATSPYAAAEELERYLGDPADPRSRRRSALRRRWASTISPPAWRRNARHSGTV